MSTEEIRCEENFRLTTSRANDGRFVVQLPFKDNINGLCESKELAIKRFHSLEKRLAKHPNLKQQYKKLHARICSIGSHKINNG